MTQFNMFLLDGMINLRVCVIASLSLWMEFVVILHLMQCAGRFLGIILQCFQDQPVTCLDLSVFLY